MRACKVKRADVPSATKTTKPYDETGQRGQVGFCSPLQRPSEAFAAPVEVRGMRGVALAHF